MIRPLFAAVLAGTTLLASPLCRGALAAEDEPRIIDGIAAIVNGDIITYSQVRGLSAPRERLLRTQFHGAELEKQIQEEEDRLARHALEVAKARVGSRDEEKLCSRHLAGA